MNSGRKRLVLFLTSLRRGGAERVAANLANSLCQRGYDITIITTYGEQATDYPLDTAVNRIALDLTRPNKSIYEKLSFFIHRLRVIRREVRQCKPDLVLSMVSSNNVLMLLSLFGSRIPVVVSERTYPPNSVDSRAWKILRKYVYALARTVVVQTDQSKQWIIGNTHARRTDVVPNMVVWPLDAFAGAKDPAEYCTPDRKMLLSVGRLVDSKNYSQLIDVFSKLCKKHKDWDLYIVGAGSGSGAGDDQDIAHALKSRTRELGIEDRVFLTGSAGNVGDWYARADAYVSASLVEGFPNSLLEAMASGCAVVSFDCLTGPAELIDHRCNGFLARLNDAEHLEQGLDLVMSDDALRQRYQAESVNVREKYKLDYVLEQWEAVFKQALTEG